METQFSDRSCLRKNKTCGNVFRSNTGLLCLNRVGVRELAQLAIELWAPRVVGVEIDPDREDRIGDKNQERETSHGIRLWYASITPSSFGFSRNARKARNKIQILRIAYIASFARDSIAGAAMGY